MCNKKEENGKVRNGKRKAKMQSDKKGKPFEKINKMMKKNWKKDSKIVTFSTIGSFLIWLVMKLTIKEYYGNFLEQHLVFWPVC